MQVEKVSYKKVVNLGNYQNEQIGVVVLLEPGESPHEALVRAKTFVEKSLAFAAPDEYEIARKQRIVDNPDEYSPKAVREAVAWLEENTVGGQEIPF